MVLLPYADGVTLDDVQSLIDAPSPAVLTTYRRDGSALTTPVWFRFHDGAFEVVLAEGDVKRQHLAGNPSCLLVVFEVVPPFRGVEVKGEPELVDRDVTELRVAIAGRYLGAEHGRRFAASVGHNGAPCSPRPARATGVGPGRRAPRVDHPWLLDLPPVEGARYSTLTYAAELAVSASATLSPRRWDPAP